MITGTEMVPAVVTAVISTVVPFTIATGADAAQFLEKMLYTASKKYDIVNGKVLSVRNVFFGETVDVAGLVTGGDIINQLSGRLFGERLLIPRNMLRHGETVFLDDLTVREVEDALGVTVRIVEQDGADLLAAMLGL